MDPHSPSFIGNARSSPKACDCQSQNSQVSSRWNVQERACLTLDPHEAASLNRCFVRDICASIESLGSHWGAHGLIAYTPVGSESAFDGLLPDSFHLLPQRGTGSNTRIAVSSKTSTGAPAPYSLRRLTGPPKLDSKSSVSPNGTTSTMRPRCAGWLSSFSAIIARVTAGAAATLLLLVIFFAA